MKPFPDLSLRGSFPAHLCWLIPEDPSEGACLQLLALGRVWGYSLTLFRPSTYSTQVSMLSMGLTASCCDTSFQSLHSGIRSRWWRLAARCLLLLIQRPGRSRRERREMERGSAGKKAVKIALCWRSDAPVLRLCKTS